MWAIATVAGYPVILGQLGFRLLDLGAVAASGALWWVARSRAVSADRLHTLGLLYQVAICFTLALTSFWQSYLQKGIIPSLTWVPVVVILFPLILPGPPRRMLLAAAAAGAMAPLALLVLDLTGNPVGPRRAGDTSGARPAGTRVPGERSDRAASIGEGIVETIG